MIRRDFENFESQCATFAGIGALITRTKERERHQVPRLVPQHLAALNVISYLHRHTTYFSSLCASAHDCFFRYMHALRLDTLPEDSMTGYHWWTQW